MNNDLEMVEFNVTPIANNFAIRKKNMYYDNKTRRVHIMIEFTCNTTGTDSYLFQVPTKIKPDPNRLGGFSGVAYRVNNMYIANTDVTIDLSGYCLQGVSSGITDGLFIIDYFF